MTFQCKFFDLSFTRMCVLLTIGIVGYCTHVFLQDEDATYVSFKTFSINPNCAYPVVSICITSPSEPEKLKTCGPNITLRMYSDCLKGELWNETMLTIDCYYNSSEPIQCLLGFKIRYRNTTVGQKIYNSMTLEQNNVDLVVPSNHMTMANMMCFGIDITMEKEILGLEMMIKTSIFLDNGICLSTMTPSQNIRCLLYTSPSPRDS